VSGARITVELQSPDLPAAMARWRGVGRNPAPMMRAIGTRLVSNTQDRFDVGQDPEGRPWAALSPGYAGLKRGAGILREAAMRGGLMGSITHDVVGAEVAIGSNKIYAGVHQFGAIIRAKNKPFLRFRTVTGFAAVRSVTIPARPYLGLSRTDEEDIFDTVEFFLNRR
jgi:phage virion morphogenesis protein